MFHRESYNHTQPSSQSENTLKNFVLLVYILQVVFVFSAGLFSLIPLFMSYFARMRSPSKWIDSHLRWQIQTFWFSSIFFVLSWIFGFIPFIGWPFSIMSFLVGASIIVFRTFKGVKKHNAQKSMQNLLG
ncbi:DUF4870 domain-containing protein [Spirobacillus cienkowskii]